MSLNFPLEASKESPTALILCSESEPHVIVSAKKKKFLMINWKKRFLFSHPCQRKRVCCSRFGASAWPIRKSDPLHSSRPPEKNNASQNYLRKTPFSKNWKLNTVREINLPCSICSNTGRKENRKRVRFSIFCRIARSPCTIRCTLRRFFCAP